MGKVTHMALHVSATFKSTRYLPAVILVLLTVLLIRSHSLYRGGNWNSRAPGPCVKPQAREWLPPGNTGRKTRPVGPAAECSVPGPFRMLLFP